MTWNKRSPGSCANMALAGTCCTVAGVSTLLGRHLRPAGLSRGGPGQDLGGGRSTRRLSRSFGRGRGRGPEHRNRNGCGWTRVGGFGCTRRRGMHPHLPATRRARCPIAPGSGRNAPRTVHPQPALVPGGDRRLVRDAGLHHRGAPQGGRTQPAGSSAVAAARVRRVLGCHERRHGPGRSDCARSAVQRSAGRQGRGSGGADRSLCADDVVESRCQIEPAGSRARSRHRGALHPLTGNAPAAGSTRRPGVLTLLVGVQCPPTGCNNDDAHPLSGCNPAAIPAGPHPHQR